LHRTAALAISAAFLVFAAFSPVSAGTPILNTSSFTVLGTPSVANIGCCPTGQSVWKDNLNVTALGLVILVLHASNGQTMYVTAATINPAAGGNATAYDAIFGVPSGTYSATWFVMASSGVAMSTATTETITFV